MDIKITLLDGKEYETFIDNYDPQELADTINVQDKLMVAIGEVIINKHNIKSIVKVDGQEVIV